MLRTAQRIITFEQLSVFFLGALLTLTLFGATGSDDSQPKTYTRSEQFYPIPDVDLTTMEGERISFAELLDADDKPLLLNFIFTSCPGICPVMSATFSRFQQNLGADAADRVRMISISIDPEYDTPALLQKYAQTYKAGPQWQFLTGALEDVIVVQKAFTSYRGTKMSHDPLTFLRPSPAAPWIRLQGLTGAGDLLEEYRQMVSLRQADIKQ